MSSSSKKLTYSEEWRGIPNILCPYTNPSLYVTAKMPENYYKNRYSNILALDKTRVKVGESNDYINANYVDIGDNAKVIACQAPLPTTIYDFWMMVWEHKSPYILMLARMKEKGHVKATRYWPKDGESFRIGSLKVKSKESVVDGSFTIKKIEISLNEETNTLSHIHYEGWPDYGIPKDTVDICNFVKKYLSKDFFQDHIPIIHCSAGCGRSGVVCGILRKIKTNETIPQVVLSIRKCRHGMVQTKEQYKYIYKVLKEIKV